MEKNIDYGKLKALSTVQLAMLTWRHKKTNESAAYQDKQTTHF